MAQTEYSIYSLQKRLLAVLGIVAFLFLCLFGKLFWVQVIQGQTLQLKAISQWTRDLPLAGVRGSMLDRNGNVLASSYTSYDVYVRGSNVKDADAVALFLSSLLGVDYETVKNKASKKNVSESLIARQVDENAVLAIINQNLGGIYVTETSSRQYTYGDLLTSVLGYCTIDNVGQFGLEAYYNKYLTGINGYTMTESDITGLELSNATTSFVSGVSGCDVELTIDVSIQKIVENVLEKIMIEQQSKGASAIIMNPKTGEIIAMASKPSFDLNNPPRDNTELLMSLSKNSMITDVYEPGSTFKLFTLAAALSNGVTSAEENFYDPGFRVVDGDRIKCWKTKGHGSQTLVDGVCNSCNSVFMDLGLRLGVDKLYQALQSYGIGTATGVDFSGESSGIMMNKASVKNVDLARISFGQAVAVTPLQMITSVCGILNGTLYEPRFIKSITANGVKKEFASVSKGETVSKEVSSQILSMMEQVVSKTDGLYSFVPGYRIGGKTGTAQKYENGKVATGKYVSSFVGCWPVETPEYVMLLCVDEPSAGQYYGSLVAAPYAKEIFASIFSYLQVEPTNLNEDMEKLKPTIEVPNLVGLPITQAVETLTKLELQFEIDGENGIVLEQGIPAGEKVFKRAIILLKT
ncbi:MAG: PASTA domain-containing protein [Clostridia bacterium]|nr:PASTA domain-containing protein [Clostridia bacterium]MBQ9786333.1 PASTA domain-containing protein [Clostridia bacterium]